MIVIAMTQSLRNKKQLINEAVSYHTIVNPVIWLVHFSY